MKKKIRCPECGENGIIMWCSGEMGYHVRYDKYRKEIVSDGIEYDEVSFEVYTCSCGYETTRGIDILVEVRE
tara:strand:+ start:185 stop:400 length:216 start_codon:yes stop_codon:yes gene_type:complete